AGLALPPPASPPSSEDDSDSDAASDSDAPRERAETTASSPPRPPSPAAARAGDAAPSPPPSPPYHAQLLDAVVAYRRMCPKKKPLTPAEELRLGDLTAYANIMVERGDEGPSREASLEVAAQARLRWVSVKPLRGAAGRKFTGEWWARQLRRAASHLIDVRELKLSKPGNYTRHATLFNSYRLPLMSFLAAQPVGKVTPHSFARHVAVLLDKKESTSKTKICTSTAAIWMRKLGLQRRPVRKGVYYNGHERPDIVRDRKAFLETFFTQIFPSPSELWLMPNDQAIRNKSRSKITHFSAFIIESSETARLSLSESQLAAHALLPPDAQLKETDARTIIEPGKGNTTIPADDPRIPFHLRGIAQDLTCPPDLPPSHPHYKNRGQCKGMRQTALERGLVTDPPPRGTKALVKKCKACTQSGRKKAARVRAERLQKQADAEGFTFDPELQMLIEEKGHLCFFLPAYHCELNPIELYWVFIKNAFRKEADGKHSTARKRLPEIANACPPASIRKMFAHAYRYMSAYHDHNLSGEAARYAVHKYKSHRQIPDSIMMDVAIVGA
ncbi:hypothetical protein JCM10207_003463, partial [Rhodosporidiobolus poonsookiae]